MLAALPSEAVFRKNTLLLYAIYFFKNAYFVLPISVLFGTEYLNLSYFQAGSLIFVPLGVSLFLDFFGGTVADAIGRKKAFVAGGIMQVLFFAPYLFTTSYEALLLSLVFYGIGLALSMNSVDTLLYEQCVSLGREGAYQQISAHFTAYTFWGRILASITGGWLFLFDPRLPYLFYEFMLIAALGAGILTRFEESREKGKFFQGTSLKIQEAARFISANSALLKFVIIGLLVGFTTDAMFSYYQPYFIERHISPYSLGIFYSSISAFSALGAYVMRRLPNYFSGHVIFSFCFLGIGASMASLLFLPAPYLFIGPMIMGVTGGFIMPNIRLSVNRMAENRVRSSVLSAATAAYGFGSLLGFVFSYGVADAWSSEFVLGVALSGTFAAFLLNAIWARQPDPVI